MFKMYVFIRKDVRERVRNSSLHYYLSLRNLEAAGTHDLEQVSLLTASKPARKLTLGLRLISFKTTKSLDGITFVIGSKNVGIFRNSSSSYMTVES